MHTHWARLIETLHAAEMIRDLLHDADLQGTDLMVTGKREAEGVGIIEAPRGTLFHHYRVSPDDQIVMANLIVSTTNNNEPMNRAVNYVARALMTKAKEITEGMMNARGSGHPGLRPVPELRHARIRLHAAGGYPLRFIGQCRHTASDNPRIQSDSSHRASSFTAMETLGVRTMAPAWRSSKSWRHGRVRANAPG